MKKLKENIIIYPRYSSLQITRLQTILGLDNRNTLIYHGKVDNIPESIAKDLCDWMFWDEKPDRRRYYNYGKRVGLSYPFLTAKESIKSACDDAEFCIIVRKSFEDVNI